MEYDPPENWLRNEPMKMGECFKEALLESKRLRQQVRELEFEVQRLRKAFTEMREHMCDSASDKTCSQMWYQDVIDEALKE